MDGAGSGPREVAVIRLLSIELFAREHQGWSKDTTLRYLTVLEALEILSRHRKAEYTELHVPLAAWSPNAEVLSALDDLLEEDAKRAKLQQLAVGVRERFLLLYGSPNSRLSLFEDLLATLTDVQDLLNKRLSPTKRKLLQLRVESLKIRLEADATKGDFRAGSSSSNGVLHAGKGDFQTGPESTNSQISAQKGDFRVGPSPTNVPLHAEKGDFRIGQGSINGQVSTQKGDFQEEFPVGPAQKGDFRSGSNPTNVPHHTEKGDFQTSQEGQNASKGDFQNGFHASPTQEGDFQRESGLVVAEKGHFQGESLAPSFNDNVITIYNDKLKEDYDSVNDEEAQEDRYTPKEAGLVGRQLANFLEKTPRNTGGFVNKAKQCSRTVIRAAVIDVLVHTAFPTVDPADERGRPKNRAGWFHDACNKYANGASIPAFIEVWVKTNLSWQEIEQELDAAATLYRRYMVEPHAADLVRRFLRGEIEKQTLDQALQKGAPDSRPIYASEPSQTVASPAGNDQLCPTEKTWMDEYEAEELAKEIIRDAGPLGVTEAKALPDQGVFIVALIWRGASMSMQTPQEWRSHLKEVRACFAMQDEYTQ